ncbi:hypothetical protein SAMN02745164_00043 [Marinitoga hydrogenitolerans DSM 16785]|uniref:DUF2194 domain-containing protein n=1 Tax=Marinitoga hydrogenitolerans (strain DSM 16785 / JCM 12826 / AT1271) TaxID=1122195 RepID=A0A1M4S5B0_MARH1|nr:DUF2194 domain-containing protein [Marinitoga hydrogenitolerans]SHE27369.1 hypothetical protein SAMN02745164_00043 [Marinitoga hydrogenitolerans DSM 16785]
MKKLFLIILIFFTTISLFPQKNLLLLYKSSEEYGEYMFKYHVIPVLEKYKINYELKNVEDLNYYRIDSNKYFGVISWYYSPVLNNSHLYLRQLASFVENGGFFFFFNNLGVTSDIREINNLLNKIGMHYMYGYKELEKYEINYEDEYFLTIPSSTIKQPVEKYNIFGDEDVILSYEVKDNIYPMIVLSDNGGGALFGSFIDKKGNIILNIEKLILKLLNRKVGVENKVLIIKTKYDNERYLKSQKELYKIFDYAKINFEAINVDDFYNLSFIDLLPYKYIIWNTDAKYVKTKTIKRFIENGGSFIFSTILNNTPWKSSIEENNINITKIIFSNKLFPIGNNNNGETILKRYYNLSFDIQLTEEETILAYLSNENNAEIPIIWYKKEKSGYIGYIYPDIILKELRGLILQTILEMQEVSISGILNSFIFYIDDFPLPSYNIEKSDNKGNKITDDEYYYNIWWPAIKKFAEKYNIKYTIVTPLSYNGSSVPPFEFTEFFISKNNNPYKTMKEIDNSEFELGLHGYNHNSLTKDRWANSENIILSLEATKKFLSKILGHPIIISSYVAPNNLIDDFGAKYLLKSLPTIKTIGTSYESKNNFSEYLIKDNFVLVIPRSTYGYYPLSRIYLTTINTLANFGSFQHFIHPDDLFAEDRNPQNKTWDEMYSNLEEFYNTIKTKFPWLRNQTASEAYPYFFDYLTQKVKYYWKNNILEIILPDSSLFPKYFMIKSKMAIRKISGGRVIHYYRKNNLYILEMKNNIMKIEFLGVVQ